MKKTTLSNLLFLITLTLGLSSPSQAQPRCNASTVAGIWNLDTQTDHVTNVSQGGADYSLTSGTFSMHGIVTFKPDHINSAGGSLIFSGHYGSFDKTTSTIQSHAIATGGALRYSVSPSSIGCQVYIGGADPVSGIPYSNPISAETSAFFGGLANGSTSIGGNAIWLDVFGCSNGCQSAAAMHYPDINTSIQATFTKTGP